MRITGGMYRSREVFAPSGDATRPTASIVREAVYNILGSKVIDARMLDLFCGSGIMSFEALSRGAVCAALVDSSQQAISAAIKNTGLLCVSDRCVIIKSDYSRAIKKLEAQKRSFDFAYLDPPYKKGLYKSALDMCFESVMADDAVCFCEYASRDGFNISGELWQTVETRSYGSRAIALVRRK